MSTILACPVCLKENTYQDADLYICADCFHEWPVSGNALGESADTSESIVRDSNGNPLADGDSVISMYFLHFFTVLAIGQNDF